LIRIYIAVLLLLAVLGERHWLLILLRYMPPFVFAVPLAAILLLRKTSRLEALLALAVFLVFYSGLELHWPRKGDLSVLTWNIHAGVSGLPQIKRQLEALKPDIVLLQEARVPEKGGPDPLEQLTDGYHVARGGNRGELAILSRFPIEQTQDLPLWPSRPGLLADLRISDQKSLRVINVHYGVGDPGQHLFSNKSGFRAYLYRTAEARKQQTLKLEPYLTDNVLVGGDFNSTPNSFAIRTLSKSLHRARVLGFGLTYPAHRPIWRIDYLFSSMPPRSCRTLHAKGSDHLPVLATY
jgi:endonuclease/exonuclease/phosphatase (EEP) superfamily protein YafD